MGNALPPHFGLYPGSIHYPCWSFPIVVASDLTQRLFGEEAAEPNGFFGSMREGDVLGLHGREHNHRLLLGQPADKTVGEAERIARDGEAVGL